MKTFFDEVKLLPPPKKKLPLILLSIALALSFVTFGYSLGKNSETVATHVFKISPTPSPTPIPSNPLLTSIKTSQWQTYKNEELNFSVKYPPTLSLQTDENRALFAKEIDPKNTHDAHYQIIIDVEEGNERTVELAVESLQERYKNLEYTTAYTLLGDIKALKVMGIGTEWPQTLVIGTNGTQVITMTLVFFGDTNEKGQLLQKEASSYFDSMVATFTTHKKTDRP